LTYDVGVAAPTRETLTRDRIIEAAVAFADQHGVEALSMRKLGAELDVEAMSLYNHVANKDDIHDGMIDYVFSTIPLPDPDEAWKTAIRRIGMAAMDVFTLHAWTVILLMSRSHFGPSFLRFADRVIGTFTKAGFNDEDAHHAWQMLASHTMGYALRQATNPELVVHGVGFSEIPAEQLAEAYPNVARLAPLLECCEYVSEFAFGLDIIIDGLDARLTQP